MASRPPKLPIFRVRLPEHQSLIEMPILDISNMSLSNFNKQILLERTREKIKELSHFEMKGMTLKELELQISIERKVTKEGYCDLCSRGPYVYSSIWDNIKLWLCKTCKNDLEKI